MVPAAARRIGEVRGRKQLGAAGERDQLRLDAFERRARHAFARLDRAHALDQLAHGLRALLVTGIARARSCRGWRRRRLRAGIVRGAAGRPGYADRAENRALRLDQQAAAQKHHARKIAQAALGLAGLADAREPVVGARKLAAVLAFPDAVRGVCGPAKRSRSNTWTTPERSTTATATCQPESRHSRSAAWAAASAVSAPAGARHRSRPARALPMPAQTALRRGSISWRSYPARSCQALL